MPDFKSCGHERPSGLFIPRVDEYGKPFDAPQNTPIPESLSEVLDLIMRSRGSGLGDGLVLIGAPVPLRGEELKRWGGKGLEGLQDDALGNDAFGRLLLGALEDLSTLEDETADIMMPDSFDSELAREELVRYSEQLAKYVHDNDIANLVLIDRRARPAYIGFKYSWDSMYGDKPKPGIYFINPRGFLTAESTTMDYVNEQGRISRLTLDKVEDDAHIRTKSLIDKDFQQKYRTLIADSDKPVLLFDTCIHLGKTLPPVVQAFIRAGFADIRLGAVKDTQQQPKALNLDLELMPGDSPANHCIPYGAEVLVQKTYQSCSSVTSAYASSRDYGKALRHEINRIFQEHYSSANQI